MDRERLDALDANMAQANVAFLATSELGGAREEPDLVIWSCGMPVADFNVAFPVAPLRDLQGCLDRGRAFFAERKLPWRLTLRRQLAEEASAELAAAGLAEVERHPGMVLEPIPDPPPQPAGLEIRPVRSAEELAAFGATAFLGFGLPEALGAKFITRDFLERPGVALYLGRLDGRPVCTAAHVLTGELVGVYWVATLEGLRGRGLGEAITWAAVAAGVERGGRWSCLQASRLGRPVYERMGFRTPTEYLHFEAREEG